MLPISSLFSNALVLCSGLSNLGNASSKAETVEAEGGEADTAFCNGVLTSYKIVRGDVKVVSSVEAL